ncbi:MAG TPA: HD domain-containing protein, partial [Candidatus Omnitrophica bacterium]|nr:HD domain-containing protein [Candidatus Omnitrophota bacterium]
GSKAQITKRRPKVIQFRRVYLHESLLRLTGFQAAKYWFEGVTIGEIIYNIRRRYKALDRHIPNNKDSILRVLGITIANTKGYHRPAESIRDLIRPGEEVYIDVPTAIFEKGARGRGRKKSSSPVSRGKDDEFTASENASDLVKPRERILMVSGEIVEIVVNDAAEEYKTSSPMEKISDLSKGLRQNIHIIEGVNNEIESVSIAVGCINEAISEIKALRKSPSSEIDLFFSIKALEIINNVYEFLRLDRITDKTVKIKARGLLKKIDNLLRCGNLSVVKELTSVRKLLNSRINTLREQDERYRGKFRAFFGKEDKPVAVAYPESAGSFNVWFSGQGEQVPLPLEGASRTEMDVPVVQRRIVDPNQAVLHADREFKVWLRENSPLPLSDQIIKYYQIRMAFSIRAPPPFSQIKDIFNDSKINSLIKLILKANPSFDTLHTFQKYNLIREIILKNKITGFEKRPLQLISFTPYYYAWSSTVPYKVRPRIAGILMDKIGLELVIGRKQAEIKYIGDDSSADWFMRVIEAKGLKEGLAALSMDNLYWVPPTHREVIRALRAKNKGFKSRGVMSDFMAYHNIRQIEILHGYILEREKQIYQVSFTDLKHLRAMFDLALEQSASSPFDSIGAGQPQIATYYILQREGYFSRDHLSVVGGNLSPCAVSLRPIRNYAKSRSVFDISASSPIISTYDELSSKDLKCNAIEIVLKRLESDFTSLRQIVRNKYFMVKGKKVIAFIGIFERNGILYVADIFVESDEGGIGRGKQLLREAVRRENLNRRESRKPLYFKVIETSNIYKGEGKNFWGGSILNSLPNYKGYIEKIGANWRVRFEFVSSHSDFLTSSSPLKSVSDFIAEYGISKAHLYPVVIDFISKSKIRLLYNLYRVRRGLWKALPYNLKKILVRFFKVEFKRINDMVNQPIEASSHDIVNDLGAYRLHSIRVGRFAEIFINFILDSIEKAKGIFGDNEELAQIAEEIGHISPVQKLDVVIEVVHGAKGHDVGKATFPLDIPDNVLPGLPPYLQPTQKDHTLSGAFIAKRFGWSFNIQKMIEDHHANSRGYPEIGAPWRAHTVEIIDIFDAMVAPGRHYQRQFSIKEIREMLRKLTKEGKLDPVLTEIFLSMNLDTMYKKVMSVLGEYSEEIRDWRYEVGSENEKGRGILWQAITKWVLELLMQEFFGKGAEFGWFSDDKATLIVIPEGVKADRLDLLNLRMSHAPPSNIRRELTTPVISYIDTPRGKIYAFDIIKVLRIYEEIENLKTKDIAELHRVLLRYEVMQKRFALSDNEIKEKSERIEERLFVLKEFKAAEIIIFYTDIQNEVKTSKMIERAQREGKQVAVFSFKDDLVKVKMKDDNRQINPEDADLVVVPGVVFDRRGYRVGLGEARYNKFLWDLIQKKKVIMVALGFDFQFQREIPYREDGTKVDIVLTDKKSFVTIGAFGDSSNFSSSPIEGQNFYSVKDILGALDSFSASPVEFDAVIEVHYSEDYGSYLKQLRNTGIIFKTGIVAVYSIEDIKENKRRLSRFPGINMIVTDSGMIPREELGRLFGNDMPRNIILVGKYRYGCLKSAFESLIHYQKTHEQKIVYHLIGDMIKSARRSIVLPSLNSNYLPYYIFAINQRLTVSYYLNGDLVDSNISNAKKAQVRLFYWSSLEELQQKSSLSSSPQTAKGKDENIPIPAVIEKLSPYFNDPFCQNAAKLVKLARAGPQSRILTVAPFIFSRLETFILLSGAHLHILESEYNPCHINDLRRNISTIRKNIPGFSFQKINHILAKIEEARLNENYYETIFAIDILDSGSVNIEGAIKNILYSIQDKGSVFFSFHLGLAESIRAEEENLKQVKESLTAAKDKTSRLFRDIAGQLGYRVEIHNTRILDPSQLQDEVTQVKVYKNAREHKGRVDKKIIDEGLKEVKLALGKFKARIAALSSGSQGDISGMDIAVIMLSLKRGKRLISDREFIDLLRGTAHSRKSSESASSASPVENDNISYVFLRRFELAKLAGEGNVMAGYYIKAESLEAKNQEKFFLQCAEDTIEEHGEISWPKTLEIIREKVNDELHGLKSLALWEQLDKLFKIINIDRNLGIKDRCLLVHAALLDALRKLGHRKAKLYFVEDLSLDNPLQQTFIVIEKNREDDIFIDFRALQFIGKHGGIEKLLLSSKSSNTSSPAEEKKQNPELVENVLWGFLKSGIKRLGAECGAVLLSTGKSRYLQFVVIEGGAKNKLRYVFIPYNKGLSGEVFVSGKPRIVNKEDMHIVAGEVDDYTGFKTKNILAFPVNITPDDIIGVAEFVNAGRGSFNQSDIDEIKGLFNIYSERIEEAYRYLIHDDLYFRQARREARKIEKNDADTLGHSERVSNYTVKMAEELGWSFEMKRSARLAGLLHDRGKAGISGKLIRKRGKFNDKEYETMQSHTSGGLIGLEYFFVSSYFDLKMVKDAVLHHHENFDGSGYPFGLKGDDIPEIARIIRVVDSYDAMIMDRSYQKARSKKEAIAELIAGKGRQFDPKMADAFLRVLENEEASDKKRQPDDLMRLLLIFQKSQKQKILKRLNDMDGVAAVIFERTGILMRVIQAYCLIKLVKMFRSKLGVPLGKMKFILEVFIRYAFIGRQID